jgi:glycerol kinase
MQFTADLTRMEIKVAEVAECSAWGAAMNGLLGLDPGNSLDILASLPRPHKAYRRRMNATKAKQLHDGWLAAVKRVL